MLDPNNRTLYSSALRPPLGYRFDQAVATTYSLDLATLLTVPMYLALSFGEENREELLRDPVALLEAIQRTSTRVGIYCQEGRIHIPGRSHALYALLEPVVREVSAPGGGAFHPKLWLLRFLSADGFPLLRLVILSRNLGVDRAWDLSLVVEGRPGTASDVRNEPLARLLLWLRHAAPQGDSPNLELLASDVRHVAWDLPAGFDSIQFHLLGMGNRGWLPPHSDQLAVISPFCTAEAVRRLAATSMNPVALISRPEVLGCLAAPARERFSRVLVLAERAEGEVDDDEAPATTEELWGLHAKAYLLKRGWMTHVFVGSANATDAALLHGSNVEILAELVGKRTRVGGVDDLLSDRGFGGVLDDFQVPAQPTPVNPLEEAAIRALEAARAALAAGGLWLRCSGEDELWRVTLQAGAPVNLSGVDSLRVWVVTQSDVRAEVGAPLARGEPVRFPPMALASVCGFMAFELRTAHAPEPLRFVLNLPLEGLPTDRIPAIIRSIVHHRDAFLRYLLLLLVGLGPEDGTDPSLDGLRGWMRWQAGAGGMEEMPLLEDMTRALSRDPSRLRSIQRLLRDLDAPANPTVVPAEFMALWEVFEAALPRRNA